MATLWAQQNNDKTDAVVEISVIWSAEENPPPNVIMLRMAIVVAMRFYPKRTKKWCSLFAMTLSEHRAPPKIDAWSWASSFPLKIALSDPSETPYFPTEIILLNHPIFLGTWFSSGAELTSATQCFSAWPVNPGAQDHNPLALWDLKKRIRSLMGSVWVRESLNCGKLISRHVQTSNHTKMFEYYIYMYIYNYTHIILDVPPWSSFSW